MFKCFCFYVDLEPVRLLMKYIKRRKKRWKRQKWHKNDRRVTQKLQKWLERDTKMTRKWHKNDWKVTHKWRVVPVERAVALAGGLGVAQRSRGSTCIGKTLGKHWKTFGNAPTPGQVPISHLSKCTRYLLCLCRPMVVYFCAVQCQVRLVRMRGNVNKIPSKLMLKKLM